MAPDEKIAAQAPPVVAAFGANAPTPAEAMPDPSPGSRRFAMPARSLLFALHGVTGRPRLVLRADDLDLLLPESGQRRSDAVRLPFGHFLELCDRCAVGPAQQLEHGVDLGRTLPLCPLGRMGFGLLGRHVVQDRVPDGAVQGVNLRRGSKAGNDQCLHSPSQEPPNAIALRSMICSVERSRGSG